MTRWYDTTLVWGPRAGTVDGYRDQLVEVLDRWANVHEDLRAWYGSSPARGVEVPLDPRSIRELLVEEHETWEHGDTKYQAWSVHLDNALPGLRRVRGRLRCGVDQPLHGVFFGNEFDVSLFGGERASRTREQFHEMLAVAVEVFAPDWGTVRPKGAPRVSHADALAAPPDGDS